MKTKHSISNQVGEYFIKNSEYLDWDDDYDGIRFDELHEEVQEETLKKVCLNLIFEIRSVENEYSLKYKDRDE